VPKDQILLEIASTQVEVPVFQSKLFGRKLLTFSAGDRDGRRHRGTYDPELARSDFDLAGFHVRVPHLRRARADLALERYHRLQTELSRALDDVGRRPFGIEGNLDEPSAIPEVEKDDSAKVPRAVYPATEPDVGTDVGYSELAAEMRASGRRETRRGGSGGQRRKVWVELAIEWG
jgi:hypothetical protein